MYTWFTGQYTWYSWECSYGLHPTNLDKFAPLNVVCYGHTRTESICEVFSPYKCSLYTGPHKLRPTMDNLSELVQTNAFQTSPTPLPSSLEYVRNYWLVRCSSQVKISLQVMVILMAQLTNIPSWWRLGHENISTAILPLPLIQEEQLSVTGTGGHFHNYSIPSVIITDGTDVPLE